MNQLAPVSITDEVLSVLAMDQKGSQRREVLGCTSSESSAMEFESASKGDVVLEITVR